MPGKGGDDLLEALAEDAAFTSRVAAEEFADAELERDGYALPRKVAREALIPTMDAPGSLTTEEATACGLSRADKQGDALILRDDAHPFENIGSGQ